MLDELKIYNRALSLSEIGALAMLPTTLAGDFNFDGRVDTADYVVWRKNGGTQQDYNLWRANFGRSSGGTGASFTNSVPEPCTSLALFVGVCGCAMLFSRQR